MINDTKLAEIKTGIADSAPPTPQKREFDLKGYSPTELRNLRREIDTMLPRESLSDLDIPRELLTQYRAVLDLQTDVINDDDIPPNQRSQVAGQVASVLQQITKMQGEFYTAERFRSIENLMIKHMRKLPLEQAREFLKEYEELGTI